MRWALARMDSSGWTSLAGCMTLRYPRQRPRIDPRESWLGGRIFLRLSPRKGRKVGRLIVCKTGMVVVRVQGG